MSPIKPENKSRYPANWRAISDHIRFERAAGQCECGGECGRHHKAERCPEKHLRRNTRTGSVVILTVAHLDHTPENCDDANLKAMCQSCHLSLDARIHAANAAHTRSQPIPGQVCLDTP